MHFTFQRLILALLVTVTANVYALSFEAVSDSFTLDTRTSSYTNTSNIFTLDTRAQTGSYFGISDIFTLDTRDDVSGNGLPDFWETTHFGGTGVATILGDNDGDGIPNLIEFALGLDPTSATDTSGVMQTQTANVNGNDYLTFTYAQRKDATGLTYTVQYSNNLLSWNSGSLYLETVSITTKDAAFDWVTVRTKVSLDAQNAQFLRLNVTQ